MFKCPRSHVPKMCWTWGPAGRLCIRSAEFFQMLSILFYAATPIGRSVIWKYGKITKFSIFAWRKETCLATDIGYYVLVWGRTQSGGLPTPTLLPTTLFDSIPCQYKILSLRVRKEWWWERNQHILILSVPVLYFFLWRDCMAATSTYVFSLSTDLKKIFPWKHVLLTEQDMK